MVLSIGPYTLLMFGEIDENEEVILWRGFARKIRLVNGKGKSIAW